MISLADSEVLNLQKPTFFISNRGFTERYLSDKVHAIQIEEVPLQTMLRDGANFRRLTSLIGLKYLSAFKFRAKYSHINL